MRQLYAVYLESTGRVVGAKVCAEEDAARQETGEVRLLALCPEDEMTDRGLAMESVSGHRVVGRGSDATLEPLIVLPEPSSVHVSASEPVVWTSLPENTQILVDGELIGLVESDGRVELELPVPSVYRVELRPAHTYAAASWEVTVDG